MHSGNVKILSDCLDFLMEHHLHPQSTISLSTWEWGFSGLLAGTVCHPVPHLCPLSPTDPGKSKGLKSRAVVKGRRGCWLHTLDHVIEHLYTSVFFSLKWGY